MASMSPASGCNTPTQFTHGIIGIQEEKMLQKASQSPLDQKITNKVLYDKNRQTLYGNCNLLQTVKQ